MLSTARAEDAARFRESPIISRCAVCMRRSSAIDVSVLACSQAVTGSEELARLAASLGLGRFDVFAARGSKFMYPLLSKFPLAAHPGRPRDVRRMWDGYAVRLADATCCFVCAAPSFRSAQHAGSPGFPGPGSKSLLKFRNCQDGRGRSTADPVDQFPKPPMGELRR